MVIHREAANKFVDLMEFLCNSTTSLELAAVHRRNMLMQCEYRSSLLLSRDFCTHDCGLDAKCFFFIVTMVTYTKVPVACCYDTKQYATIGCHVSVLVLLDVRFVHHFVALVQVLHMLLLSDVLPAHCTAICVKTMALSMSLRCIIDHLINFINDAVSSYSLPISDSLTRGLQMFAYLCQVLKQATRALSATFLYAWLSVVISCTSH